MESTKSVIQLFSFDYTQSLARDCNGLGSYAGCLLPFAMKSKHKKQLLTKGVNLIINQVVSDLQCEDVDVVLQALVVTKDLMLAHSGESKELVLKSLRNQGVVHLTSQIFIRFALSQHRLLACHCLMLLLEHGDLMEQVLEDGIVGVMVNELRQGSELSSAILKIMLLMLTQKQELLHVLIALERANAPSVLLSLLTSPTSFQTTLLKVLQIILRKSQLAVKQLIQSQGIEAFSRWLANFKEKTSTTEFRIGFEMIVDLILKHENLSHCTKFEALGQLQRGGVANIVTRALAQGSQQADAIYALSQICEVQGATDVVAHLLQGDDFKVLVNAACSDVCSDQSTKVYACIVIKFVLDSAEGYQALRCLAQCRGLAQLILKSELSDNIVMKVCSHGGQSILLGLSCGRYNDVIAAAEALAAVAIVQPAHSTTTLMHNNLVINLIHDCLQQIKNNQDGVIVDIVQKLFSSLPTKNLQEFGRSVSLTQQYQQQYPSLDRNSSSPFDRLHTLQSQNSSHSTRSSLSRASSTRNSIPREEVNLKRYDSATFVVGGRECYAMGWIMEQQSPFFYQKLNGLKNIKGERIIVPRIPGISEDKRSELFQLAVEFAYTNSLVQIEEQDILPLWAVSRELEIFKLQQYCEDLVTEELIFNNNENLLQVLSWLFESSNNSNGESAKIWSVCVDGIVNRFQEFRECGILKQLVEKYIEQLTVGMAGILRQRLQNGFQKIEIHSSSPEIPESTPETCSHSDQIST
eukprot:TRINITY_DN4928_c0_g1_i1.p1 TRINITY_DN4928_c0_g1~~TRINITY_DN4928_c0_g1_i1.p1  ORF type:complete len:750 (+),score=80.61 TRINITY_DN4928_c0_g1_i1:110-2359(+)